jgi:hypothetical protein
MELMDTNHQLNTSSQSPKSHTAHFGGYPSQGLKIAFKDTPMAPPYSESR